MDAALVVELAKSLGLPVAGCLLMLYVFSQQQKTLMERNEKQQETMFGQFSAIITSQLEQQKDHSKGLIEGLDKLAETLKEDRERFFRVLERNSVWLERQTQEAAVQTYLQQQQRDSLGHLSVVADKAAEVAEKVVTDA